MYLVPSQSLTSVCLPIVHALPPSPSGFSLSCQFTTLSHFWLVRCLCLVIHTLIHHILNTPLGRSKSVSAAGRPRSVKPARPMAALSIVLWMHDQFHPRINGTIGGPWCTHRTASGSNEDINGMEQRFRIEIFSTPKRTETPGSRKLCVGCERYQVYQTRDGKETIRVQKRKRIGRMNYAQSLQLLRNGSVFP